MITAYLLSKDITSPTATSARKVVDTPVRVVFPTAYTIEPQVGETSVLLLSVPSELVFALVAPHIETLKLFPKSPAHFATKSP